jgi:preprotein translocase subunit SecE
MKLLNYLKDVRSEMKHVSWPTRKQAISFTVVVVAISLLTAAYIGVFDYIFQEIISFFF